MGHKLPVKIKCEINIPNCKTYILHLYERSDGQKASLSTVYTVTLNCFYKLRGMIVPIQTINNYMGRGNPILFWEVENRKVEIYPARFLEQVVPSLLQVVPLLYSERHGVYARWSPTTFFQLDGLDVADLWLLASSLTGSQSTGLFFKGHMKSWLYELRDACGLSWRSCSENRCCSR